MNANIAIIGAGIAGVSAARFLQDHGCSVTIIEKSRGYGGRCASKRWLGHIVDHGAQYFTMRDERFRAAAQSASGVKLHQMNTPILNQHGQIMPDHGRWFHRDGNSRLVRDLAQGITVQTEQAITDANSLLKSHGGNFDHIISTAPWPQTAALVGSDTIINYAPCLTALFAYEGDWLGNTSAAYSISDHDGPLAWSACENHKSGRIERGFTVMVAQMSESFSREYLEIPATDIPDLIRSMLEKRWDIPTEKFHAALGHRWRYARIIDTASTPALRNGLHYAGDANGKSRVESSWLDGLRIAENLLANIA